MIPIYAKNQNGQSYSIYLDIDTMRVYRNDHGEMNQTKYWVSFFAVFFILRELAKLNFPDVLLIKVLILLVTIPASILIGIAIHRKSHLNIREIYPTKDMLENYIESGKHLMKRELSMAVIILSISLFLAVLFIIFNWMAALIFSLFSFLILGMLSNNISLKRWKLYKHGLNEA